MIRLTYSLAEWLYENHAELLPLIMRGHAELMTEEMYGEYIEWCKTDEGKKYLKGGEKYEAYQKKRDTKQKGDEPYV